MCLVFDKSHFSLVAFWNDLVQFKTGQFIALFQKEFGEPGFVIENQAGLIFII